MTNLSINRQANDYNIGIISGIGNGKIVWLSMEMRWYALMRINWELAYINHLSNGSRLNGAQLKVSHRNQRVVEHRFN